MDEIQNVLKEASFETHAQTNTILEKMLPITQPPTYYETNRFTEGFQLIVEAYGVARYQEVRFPPRRPKQTSF